MNRGTARGFTLIELLVVIAIVMVLAAILSPVYLSAREHAKQSNCLANLGQLARATRQYSDDWNGRLPVAWIGSSPPGTTDWCGCSMQVPQQGQIYRYVKNAGIYKCPSDAGRAAPAIGGTLQQQKDFISYSMNRSLSWRSVENMQLPGRPDSGGTWRASKMLLLIHEKRETINDGNFEWPAATWWDVPDNVHYEGTTVVFLDTHARWQSATSIKKAIARGEYNPDYPRAPAGTPPGPL